MTIQKLSEMPWYLMSKQNQLTYAHLLNRLQNGAVFHVGPFAELNLVTFSKVDEKMDFMRNFYEFMTSFFQMTNRIYSFVMALRRVLQ